MSSVFTAESWDGEEVRAGHLRLRQGSAISPSEREEGIISRTRLDITHPPPPPPPPLYFLDPTCFFCGVHVLILTGFTIPLRCLRHHNVSYPPFFYITAHSQLNTNDRINLICLIIPKSDRNSPGNVYRHPFNTRTCGTRHVT